MCEYLYLFPMVLSDFIFYFFPFRRQGFWTITFERQDGSFRNVCQSWVMVILLRFRTPMNTFLCGNAPRPSDLSVYTGEEVSIDKQVACEECPRWLKMTEVA